MVEINMKVRPPEAPKFVTVDTGGERGIRVPLRDLSDEAIKGYAQAYHAALVSERAAQLKERTAARELVLQEKAHKAGK